MGLFKIINKVIKISYRLDVTDFIYQIVQVLRKDLERLAVSTQEAGLIEPVELWDKG